MHAIAPPLHQPSASTPEVPDGEALALLLDLMVDEPDAVLPVAGTPGPGMAARVQEWSRRAASWGAGPQGAWRAW